MCRCLGVAFSQSVLRFVLEIFDLVFLSSLFGVGTPLAPVFQRLSLVDARCRAYRDILFFAWANFLVRFFRVEKRPLVDSIVCVSIDGISCLGVIRSQHRTLGEPE